MKTNNKVSEPNFMGGSGYFDITPIGANVVFFARNRQGSEKNKHPYYEDADIEAAKQKAEFICKATNEYDKIKRDKGYAEAEGKRLSEVATYWKSEYDKLKDDNEIMLRALKLADNILETYNLSSSKAGVEIGEAIRKVEIK